MDQNCTVIKGNIDFHLAFHNRDSVYVLTMGPYFTNKFFNSGPKNPEENPIKLIIEYNVPAKFGARSWEFCKFVNVAEPLNPNESVRIDMIRPVFEIYGIASSKSPGRI